MSSGTRIFFAHPDFFFAEEELSLPGKKKPGSHPQSRD